MEQIGSLERISALASAQLRRGVRTNLFLTADNYRLDIAQGTLWAHTWPGGLVVLRRRKDHQRLNFSLHDLSCPPDIAWVGPTVTEIPIRPKDSGADELVRFWERLGFCLRLERVRLQRAAEPETSNAVDSVRPAWQNDSAALLALMRQCFDPLTGCLPTPDELSADIEAGRVLCFEADGAVIGLVHFSVGNATSEIKHFAVSPERRGEHVASRLLAQYLRLVRPKKDYTVWTGADNTAALALYRSGGFKPDGWRSFVLVKY